MKDLTRKKSLIVVKAIMHCGKRLKKKSGRRRNICDILSSNEQVEKFEKRYKEVVDNNSKTGKEKCTWKHLKTFSVWK